MATINTHIIFKEHCEEAFRFYQSIFGGKYSYFGRFKEMPMKDVQTVPAEVAEKIMHISLPISKETALSGSDSYETFGTKTIYGNNFSLSVNAASKEEADTLFKALSANGKVEMAMEDTFWGGYFGTFTDQFGVNWMINFDKSKAK